MGHALLKVKDISKTFGGVCAIVGVSFEIDKGTLFSIIGPNGAGKTTLFNCISGITKPDQGQIIWNLDDIANLDPTRIAKKGIARTFQNLELFDKMTVVENILMGRHRHMKTNLWQAMAIGGRNRFAAREEIENRRKAIEIAKFLHLDTLAEKLVTDLSYGIRKWVELGRALATEPSLLLLDEPAAGMSFKESQKLFETIQKIRDSYGATIIIIEHNLKLVMEHSDQILALNFGKRVICGPPADVAKHPEVIKACMGS